MTAAMASKGKKSSLMTPDPYHIPGYCGYVPQFKYKLGETFGWHTHKLLTDTSVASSGHPVLAGTDPSLPPPPKTQEDFFRSAVSARTRSWGNQKYAPQMVPGYTGYIPKGQHHFGCRYAEACHYAISSFETDQQKHEAKMAEMRKGQCSDHTSSPHPLNTPLKPIASRPKPYLPAYAKQHSISPFFMPNGHPEKYFMSGYTGFIPKAQKYIGQSYPIITGNALQEHFQECERLEASLQEPVILQRSRQAPRPTNILYSKGCGFMPHYTGHIPGQKYKYGTTFGSSTRKAVSEITA